MLIPLSSITAIGPQPRLFTVPVLDKVTGGGLPLGGSTLIGGAPGAGKSTLLLEAATAVPWETFYFTGEETVAAIARRSRRLGLQSAALKVAETRSADEIAEAIASRQPALCVVDSIQTVVTSRCKSAARTPGQLRTITEELCSAAMRAGTALVLVCHETKVGGFAGPRAVEHLVDVALRMEREPARRIVAVKNRFGPAPVAVDLDIGCMAA